MVRIGRSFDIPNPRDTNPVTVINKQFNELNNNALLDNGNNNLVGEIPKNDIILEHNPGDMPIIDDGYVVDDQDFVPEQPLLIENEVEQKIVYTGAMSAGLWTSGVDLEYCINYGVLVIFVSIVLLFIYYILTSLFNRCFWRKNSNKD